MGHSRSVGWGSFRRPRRTWRVWRRRVWRRRVYRRLLWRLLRTYSINSWSLRSLGLLNAARSLLHHGDPPGFGGIPSWSGQRSRARLDHPPGVAFLDRPVDREIDVERSADSGLEPGKFAFDFSALKSDRRCNVSTHRRPYEKISSRLRRDRRLGRFDLRPERVRRPRRWPTGPDAAMMQRMQERQAVMLDAHLAAMKAGLKLTDEQAKNWPAFESAIRDAEKARADRWRQAQERMSSRRTPLADRAHDDDVRASSENGRSNSRRSPMRPSLSMIASPMRKSAISAR